MGQWPAGRLVSKAGMNRGEMADIDKPDDAERLQTQTGLPSAAQALMSALGRRSTEAPPLSGRSAAVPSQLAQAHQGTNTEPEPLELTESMRVSDGGTIASVAPAPSAVTAPSTELRVLRVANGWIISEVTGNSSSA